MGNYLDRFRSAPQQEPATQQPALEPPANPAPKYPNDPANYKWDQPDASPFKQTTSSNKQQPQQPTPNVDQPAKETQQNQQQQPEQVEKRDGIMQQAATKNESPTATNPQKLEGREQREVVSSKSARRSSRTADLAQKSNIMMGPKTGSLGSERREVDQQKAAKTDNIAAIHQADQKLQKVASGTPAKGAKVIAKATKTTPPATLSTTISASKTTLLLKNSASNTLIAKKSSGGGVIMSAKKSTTSSAKKSATLTRNGSSAAKTVKKSQ